MPLGWQCQVRSLRGVENQVLTIDDRKAQKLFSSEKEAITFAEDYGFDSAHVELLRKSGMLLKSAEVLVNSGRIADAVKTLISPPRAQDRTRRAVECLVTGLWKYQSFGMDYPTTDEEAVSELLELANTLKNNMHAQEAEEVCLLFTGSATPTLRTTDFDVQSKT